MGCYVIISSRGTVAQQHSPRVALHAATLQQAYGGRERKNIWKGPKLTVGMASGPRLKLIEISEVERRQISTKRAARSGREVVGTVGPK